MKSTNWKFCLLLMVALSPTPSVSAGTPQIAASEGAKAVITADGSLWMWGDSSAVPRAPCNFSPLCTVTRPLKVGDGFQNISVGNAHALALKTDGSLWGWGENGNGQVGDGTTQARWQPVAIGSGFISVFASGATWQGDGGHSLGIKDDGSVWAWGNNNLGQVGDGTLTSRTQPVQVASGTFIAVAATGDASAALKSDGSIWVWGGHNLINGAAIGAPLQPSQLISGFVALTANSRYFVARKSDGSVWTWGYDWLSNEQPVCANAAFGDGGGYCPQPRQLASGFTGNASSAGLKESTCCAVCSCVAGGSLWIWGQYGGDAADPANGLLYSAVPQQIGSGFTSVADGIASKADGSIWTWGGMLGDGSSVQRWVPQALPALDSQGQAVSGSTFNLNTNTQSYPVLASFGIYSSTLGFMVEPVVLSGEIQAAAADVGKTGQLFIAAHSAGNWFQYSKARGWQAATALEPYDGVTLGSHAIPLYSGMFNALNDVEVYLGYGTDANAMLANGTLRKVFPR